VISKEELAAITGYLLKEVREEAQGPPPLLSFSNILGFLDATIPWNNSFSKFF
jgi:hypothetical protein